MPKTSTTIEQNREIWEVIIANFIAMIPEADRYPKQMDSSMVEYIDRVTHAPFTRALYEKFVIDNIEDIVADADRAIQTYINSYLIVPTDGVFDELKSIYFLGSTIAQKLRSIGHFQLSKIQMKAVVRMLDWRLYEPYRAGRPLLTERVIIAINDGTLDADFGKLGLYITYKCIYNTAAERHKKANAAIRSGHGVAEQGLVAHPAAE